MGFEKIKRPILAPGISVDSSGAAGSAVSAMGDVSIDAGSLVVPTESITTSTVAQTVSENGVSFITYGTSGKPNDVILPNPSRAGIVKQLAVVNNTTSVELNVNTAATANTFWGTTFNTASISGASTGGPGGVPGGTVMLNLVSQSTSQWALFPGTTFNWDLAASTGSTATA